VKFDVELVVSLKEGLLDPQGKAVEGALPSLGWSNVSDVRVGKHVRLVVEADNKRAALEQVHQMADRFLSNPVIEDFRVIEAREHAGNLAAKGRR
jgi:phosphoribosylformylglycinamidine synthase subunit PurS